MLCFIGPLGQNRVTTSRWWDCTHGRCSSLVIKRHNCNNRYYIWLIGAQGEQWYINNESMTINHGLSKRAFLSCWFTTQCRSQGASLQKQAKTRWFVRWNFVDKRRITSLWAFFVLPFLFLRFNLILQKMYISSINSTKYLNAFSWSLCHSITMLVIAVIALSL